MQTLMSQIWKIIFQIWKITSKKTRNRDITQIRDKRAYLTQWSWDMSPFEINVSLVLRKLAITMQWSFHWPLLQKHRVSQRNIKLTSKGSHQLKKKGILWIKFIKRWPPPPPSHFYERLFFIFFCSFFDVKKNDISRVFEGFHWVSKYLESPPWTLKRQLKAHSNAF